MAIRPRRRRARARVRQRPSSPFCPRCSGQLQGLLASHNTQCSYFLSPLHTRPPLRASDLTNIPSLHLPRLQHQQQPYPHFFILRASSGAVVRGCQPKTGTQPKRCYSLPLKPYSRILAGTPEGCLDVQGAQRAAVRQICWRGTVPHRGSLRASAGLVAVSAPCERGALWGGYYFTLSSPPRRRPLAPAARSPGGVGHTPEAPTPLHRRGSARGHHRPMQGPAGAEATFSVII